MPTTDARVLTGRHVVFLSWRDTGNPEGGGAERYLEKVAAGLVARGVRVTVFSAAYAGAAPEEVVDGIRFVRRGSKLTVYLEGMRLLALRRFGRVDAVVDVQNGMPFFSALVTRRPVIVLVHHVHREQWPVVYPGFTGRVGWWIESRFAPYLYRRKQYVTVSRATRDELRGLGVRGPRVAVVHNGTDPVVSVDACKTAHPSLCVVGRLVPHKQVEHAVDAVLELRSVKEGWGLVVGEAAAHGTPTVAYSGAGGTRESIVHGVSGVLVDTAPEFTAAIRGLLRDAERRAALAEGARRHSDRFTWGHSQSAFAHVVASALRGERVDSQDAVEE